MIRLIKVIEGAVEMEEGIKSLSLNFILKGLAEVRGKFLILMILDQEAKEGVFLLQFGDIQRGIGEMRGEEINPRPSLGRTAKGVNLIQVGKVNVRLREPQGLTLKGGRKFGTERGTGETISMSIFMARNMLNGFEVELGEINGPSLETGVFMLIILQETEGSMIGTYSHFMACQDCIKVIAAPDNGSCFHLSDVILPLMLWDRARGISDRMFAILELLAQNDAHTVFTGVSGEDKGAFKVNMTEKGSGS